MRALSHRARATASAERSATSAIDDSVGEDPFVPIRGPPRVGDVVEIAVDLRDDGGPLLPFPKHSELRADRVVRPRDRRELLLGPALVDLLAVPLQLAPGLRPSSLHPPTDPPRS